MSTESDSKPQAVAHEFSQPELEILIRGMRQVEIDWGEEQLLQIGLHERFELELLHRFGMFIVDPDEEDGKKEAWADREVAKLNASA